ncbi:GNAT family N-acetyltransferase [Brevibacillus borstelensis]|uniref:GNAT family N-acetyltransferase n=1 Tax=Brevibacillus borstelensis TaxID=45462 RepID=UPI0004694BA6|nr:GNAT family N-acetyltransferase [Brevibacillus borstelensis]MCC0567332.1 GNAT family N-acetyltransferase [Brevibacillus borstelensis]MCM3472131.1 GNAT family N-acetyltransferase [Brevibacillus borstelensis]MCM3561819.1 GNAT family N-acetyltransferase [Brevibacillus borstelensis]MCM3593318.1 GNAT family N-acetyltransferase [Brevibacillus borstelensis]MED1855061.1 GNAT family N-acetyltransferase [Brevibacillus borstelensis]
MEWYERLSEYFPEQEMKDPRQLQALIENKDVYHKEETEDYLLLYAEFPTFLFIDYLLINPETRGKGIGTKLLNRLKEKGKTIILEVEPIDREDEDTWKRVNFYRKNGFVKADRIQYRREDDSGETYEMKIYYWSPDQDEPQEVILEKMAKACQEIHNFRAKRYYGRDVADPDEVLDLKQ